MRRTDEEASCRRALIVELLSVRGGASGRVLWRPCGWRLTRSLRRHLTETVEALTMKEHPVSILGQQGAEPQLGLFCSFKP
jgi:hypothetical protein